MRLDQVRVVMVRPRGPANVGIAARAIANHGLAGLTLVAPEAFDPEEARWNAPGAHAVIDQARFVASVDEAVAEATLVVAATARRRRFDWPVWGPPELAREVEARPGPAALLFGPEHTGLANEDLRRCHALFTLPTGSHSSLNLAQAITVSCHALRVRAAEDTPAPRRPAAAAALLAELSDNGLQALRAGGYLEGRSEDQVRSTLFRLLDRLAPDQEEAGRLNGMLAQVLWTLEHPQDG